MNSARQLNSRSPAPITSLFKGPGPDANLTGVWYYVTLLLLAGAYFAAAKVGLSLASVHTNVSPVWPPAGIAIAAVLLLGFRAWPGILLGALLANLLTPVPAATSVAIAIGNTLEALSAGWLLGSVNFHSSLDRARDVFKFAVAVVICTTVSASIGTASLYAGHATQGTPLGSLWLTWWLGDLAGALTVTPLILTWGTRSHDWLPRRRYLEATILLVVLSVSAIVTFGKTSPAPLHYYPLTRLIIPFLLWAAYRLGRRGVTVALVVISAFAVWGTAGGEGPFISGTPNESLILLQLYLGTNSITFLILGAVVEERRQSEKNRRHNEERLATNLAVTRILAESPDLNDAMPRVLKSIGETLGWQVGCMWKLDPAANVLRNTNVWQASASRTAGFAAVCCERTFERGIGLPGRVWTDLKPAWIPDVTKDDNFPRAPVAVSAGLHAAFAFPIMFDEKFLGIVEFFSPEIREPDEALLAMLGSVGNQIGQFMERKGAEDSLVKNQEALRLAHKIARGGTWRWDLLTNDVEWSEEYYELLGLDPARVRASIAEWTARVHPEDLSRVLKENDNAIAQKRDLDVEYRIKRADGKWRWFHRTGRCVYSAGGQPQSVVGISFDISERRRAQERSRFLGAIVESTDDAIITKDLNGIITSWNRSAERLYGYKAEEVIGKPINVLIPAERNDEEPEILAKLRRGESIDHYETVRLAKGGQRLHVSLTVSPIRNNEGRIIGASKIARDITQQKEAQAERERLLERERAAREEAEIANRTKDEFLAVLSHELRTPLTAMLGWLSILRGHRLDEKTTEHAIETIHRNAKAQAQLIEDLVDVSRIVGGKLKLEVRPIDLLPVIDAAVEVVRPAADAKGIRLMISQESAVGPVFGDPARLQQVVWNLLSNAVKFTPKGGVIFVEFRRAESSAEIIVRDTGIGIADDFLPHVFERFRQADSAVTRAHRGMGLGLAIVRHLVELHGGTVSAASRGENRGASFTIRLPLAAVTQSTLAPAADSDSTNSSAGLLNGVRVLLVEDEPDARELIALTLTNSGAKVEAVDTAGEALSRLQVFAPHVLLSDIGLPQESGYDLIRSVRALSPTLNNVPAIALTAFATENDRQMSLSAGFHEHLAKPVEPSHLIETIKGLVNDHNNNNS
ncbi:MAG: MASE1 domain-containing protein [Acidobacteriota bacterium]